MTPDPCGASCEPAEDATAKAAVTTGDLIPRAEVVAELRGLALRFAGSALMDAAAHFEGTL